MFDRTIESDPRPAAPRSRANYRMRGRPSPRIRRARGRGVHLLPRPLRAGARRRGHLPLRLVPGPGRGPLRRTSLHHPAGRERLDPRGTRQGVPGQGTEGQAVQGADAHPQGSGRHPRARRRAAPGPRTAHQVRRPPPTRPARTRHGHLPGLRARTPTAARAGRHHPARPARRRAQEHRRTPLRVRAGAGRPTGRRRRTAPRGRGTRSAHRRAGEGPVPRRTDRVHGLRRAHRPRQRRGRVGALPPGIDPGQGRRGFRMHANGPAGRRVLRILGPGGDRTSIRGPAEHDPAALEL